MTTLICFRVKTEAYFLMRLGLSFTLTLPKTLMKTEAFENDFKSGGF